MTTGMVTGSDKGLGTGNPGTFSAVVTTGSHQFTPMGLAGVITLVSGSVAYLASSQAFESRGVLYMNVPEPLASPATRPRERRRSALPTCGPARPSSP